MVCPRQSPVRDCQGGPSLKQIGFEYSLVKPDDQGFTNPHCRRTQVAGWPEHGIDGARVDGFTGLEGADFLALDGDEF